MNRMFVSTHAKGVFVFTPFSRSIVALQGFVFLGTRVALQFFGVSRATR